MRRVVNSGAVLVAVLASLRAGAADQHTTDQRTAEVLDLFKGTCGMQAATVADVDDQVRTFWTGNMEMSAAWNHARPSADSQTVWTVHAPTGDIIVQVDIVGETDDYRMICRIKAGPVDYAALGAGVKTIMDLDDPVSDVVDANHQRNIRWSEKGGPVREVNLRYVPDAADRVAWIEVTRKIK